ncbi:hypothetical protein [Aquimarina aquimarini]|uniref:hypothetical protein n=1 Tax=Aquimarina aquimarini TaxID=1191734 RepID=UPI001F42DA1E|nr:hypothetical protein [Aquimarina aquimarini]
MKNLIILFSMLLLFFIASSCETQTVNDETGIEDLQKRPEKLIDKEEIEPGTKG